MPARFYCMNIGGQTAELDESESHHVRRVLRLSVGDQVELFDGTGASASASVADISCNRVSLTLQDLRRPVTLNRSRLVVAAAPPRGDRLKSMVEKLTELGVDEFVPLRTVRSVVDPRQSKLDKLRTTVIGAMKQSGRNRLMKIHEVTEFSMALRIAGAQRQAISIAHPGDISGNTTLTERCDTLLLIGPEGGFTPEEILQASDYGAKRISWPEGILRIETATVVFAGLLISQMYPAE